MIGLVGFGVTSVLCGLAPNMEVLIVSRLFQGAAGAILVPGSLAILSTNFRGEEQARAFGIWAAASGVAPILGPFVGGLLVDGVGWRSIFLLNIPFIAVAIWARYVTSRRAATRRPRGDFDWFGALLVALAVGGLVVRGDLRAAAPVAGSACVRRDRDRPASARRPAVLVLHASATRSCRS